MSEMERNLFELEYFPFTTMGRTITLDNDNIGSSDATSSPTNSQLGAHDLLNDGGSMMTLSTEDTTDNTTHTINTTTQRVSHTDSSPNDGGTVGDEMEQRIEQRTLSLLKMEKTMLDGLGLKDFDGNYILDSLLYMVLVPLSNDQYIVR